MPKVSVIVPVCNVEPYLGDCMDSILGQSLDDFEVICVDDGSTDGSLGILEQYAARSSRLTVLTQANRGAGAARNLGLEVAKGEYLSFLDSDDLFEPTMLEDAYSACVRDRADVGVFGANYYDTTRGRVMPANRLLKTDLVPLDRPFSRADVPDHILDFTSPAPWSKLFRRAFVTERGLRFQEIRRANDFLFTKLALAMAERITVIDKALVSYRIGSQSNLQANNDETPLEFYDALIGLRNELERAGLLDDVRRSYVNTVLSACLYNLHSLRTPEGFDVLFGKLRDEYFAALEIDGHEREYFHVPRHYDEYIRIKQSSPEGYLLEEVGLLRGELARVRDQLKRKANRLEKLQRSLPYRVARRTRSAARRIKSLFAGAKGAE